MKGVNPRAIVYALNFYFSIFEFEENSMENVRKKMANLSFKLKELNEKSMYVLQKQRTAS